MHLSPPAKGENNYKHPQNDIFTVHTNRQLIETKILNERSFSQDGFQVLTYILDILAKSKENRAESCRTQKTLHLDIYYLYFSQTRVRIPPRQQYPYQMATNLIDL